MRKEEGGRHTFDNLDERSEKEMDDNTTETYFTFRCDSWALLRRLGGHCNTRADEDSNFGLTFPIRTIKFEEMLFILITRINSASHDCPICWETTGASFVAQLPGLITDSWRALRPFR